MNHKNAPRFDVETLRQAAGDKIFKRGENYFRNGRVTILSASPKRILAEVAGTKKYRVTLTGQNKTINGECTCPNYQTWGFCKHMVAVALAADGSSKEEADGDDAVKRIHAHLKAQGIEALVSLILDLAERDTALFRRLDTASIATQSSGKNAAARLRRAVDRATKITGFIDYDEVPAWSAAIEGLLETLASLITIGQANLVLELAWHIIDRIEEAVDQIDDSDGYCGDLIHRSGEIHLEAARAARPDPVKLAQALFAREMKSQYDTFSGAAHRYGDVMGDEGLREYRQLAQEQWDKLPALGKLSRNSPETGGYFPLFRILDFFAERDGSVDTRIVLRNKDLSSSWMYLQLAQFCHQHGRDTEALQRAEEGLWIFEDDRPDERLLFFTVDLLLRMNRKHEAETYLWRAFERAPSLALYERLRILAGDEVYEQAIHFLKKRLAKEKSFPWHNPADLLIRIAMHEKHFDRAWQMVREYGASLDLQGSLARATESEFPREALCVYMQRIDQLVENGGNPAYEEAVSLVRRSAALHEDAEHAAYIANLKERFGRKRNFMKLLG